jgi:hypothetical protein
MTLFRSLALIPTDANLVITQPTIKIEIWSRKAEIGLIEYNIMETYPKVPKLLEWVEWHYEAS